MSIASSKDMFSVVSVVVAERQENFPSLFYSLCIKPVAYVIPSFTEHLEVHYLTQCTLKFNNHEAKCF